MAITADSVSRRALFRYGGFVFSVGGARVAGLLVTSVTFPYLVRHLGVEMYGLWSYVVALCAFMDNIANPGLTTYTSQQIAAGREKAFALVSDTVALRLLSSALAALAVLAVSRFEVRLDIRRLLIGYGIGILIVNLVSSDYLLNALELFHERSILSVVQQVLYAAGILLLVKRPSDIFWVPVSILSSALVAGLAGWVVLWRKGLKLSWSFHPSSWKKILLPSLHYAAASLMSNFYHRTGHIAVRWFLGGYDLGLYAALVRLVDILRSLVGIVLSVFIPRMAVAARTGEGIRRLARISLAVTGLVSIPMTLGLVVAGKSVIPLALGQKYADAVRFVPWIAGYLLAAPAAALFCGTILYAMGRHRAYLASTGTGAIVGVLLYFTLTPAWGIRGAVLAFVCGEFAVAAVAYVLARRDLQDVWSNPLIAVAGAGSLLMTAFVLLLNKYCPRPFVIISAGVVAYVIACWLLGKKWLLELAGGRR